MVIIIVQHLLDYSILTLKALDRLVLTGKLPTARLDVIVITYFGADSFFLAFA